MKKVKRNVVTYAYGEVTGHSHKGEGAVMINSDYQDGDDVMVMDVLEDTSVSHEEHDYLKLDAGTSVIKVNQWEENPITQEINRVTD